jgi:homoserine dehydrogenase
MKPVQIGIIGLGTVGAGTVNLLNKNAEEITRRAGRQINIKAVAVNDTTKQRACDISDFKLTDDPFEVTDDPQIDLIVELMGGESTAREVALRALEHDKHIVTANKALIAVHGNDIFDVAMKKGLVVAFEAAVAGGISIIKVLREGLTGNRIERVIGIVNGTTNFILSEMHKKASPFSKVLAEAQRLGYAESDPSFDIEGIDAAHKLTILASIAFGIPLDFDSVFVEGITDIHQQDIAYAKEFGYSIKHLGIAKQHKGKIELRVHPCLIPADHLLANVDGVMNAILVYGDAVGPTLHYGAGAGANPTASSVVADIVDVVRTLTTDPENRVPHLAFQPEQLAQNKCGSIGDIETAYYLRLLALDRPGVLADIARILGEHQISIESIRQKGTSSGDKPVSIVILTHRTIESQMSLAIPELENLKTIREKVVRIRVETMDNEVQAS